MSRSPDAPSTQEPAATPAQGCPVCSICHAPVIAGQARYTVTDNHYDCEFPQGRKAIEQSYKDAVAKFDGALAALGVRKPRLRDGQGRTAQRCRELAARALEEAIGGPVSILSLWNQQGDYRGKKWDLDRWGLTFEFEGPEKRARHGSASCLATMTECARVGDLIASPRDIVGSFELFPRGQRAGRGPFDFSAESDGSCLPAERALARGRRQ